MSFWMFLVVLLVLFRGSVRGHIPSEYFLKGDDICWYDLLRFGNIWYILVCVGDILWLDVVLFFNVYFFINNFIPRVSGRLNTFGIIYWMYGLLLAKSCQFISVDANPRTNIETFLPDPAGDCRPPAPERSLTLTAPTLKPWQRTPWTKPWLLVPFAWRGGRHLHWGTIFGTGLQVLVANCFWVVHRAVPVMTFACRQGISLGCFGFDGSVRGYTWILNQRNSWICFLEIVILLWNGLGNLG